MTKYETLFEYIKMKDTTGYKHKPTKYDNRCHGDSRRMNPWIVGEIRPLDDPRVSVSQSDTEGYLDINFGESDVSQLNRSALNEHIFAVFTWDADKLSYLSTGKIYPTEDDAAEAIELIKVKLGLIKRVSAPPERIIPGMKINDAVEDVHRCSSL